MRQDQFPTGEEEAKGSVGFDLELEERRSRDILLFEATLAHGCLRGEAVGVRSDGGAGPPRAGKFRMSQLLCLFWETYFVKRF